MCVWVYVHIYKKHSLLFKPHLHLLEKWHQSQRTYSKNHYSLPDQYSYGWWCPVGQIWRNIFRWDRRKNSLVKIKEEQHQKAILPHHVLTWIMVLSERELCAKWRMWKAIVMKTATTKGNVSWRFLVPAIFAYFTFIFKNQILITALRGR